jgi:RNA polymerase sigma factor (sigma-70 family)
MPDGSAPIDERDELNRLMEQIRGGSQEAVREMLEKYGDALVFVIRHRLPARLRRQYDSADFAQAVWASFFTGPLDDYHFDSPESLLAFLTSIARNKVGDARRQVLDARKRAEYRVHSLDGSAGVSASGVPSPQPTPSQIYLAEDEWDRLLEAQPLPYRPILELLRHGHTQKEVAEELRLSDRTVRRVVARAFRLLEERDEP